MIEYTTVQLFKKYLPESKKRALCLGDQRPTVTTGFLTAKDLFLGLGFKEYLDIDYNGKALINQDLNYPLKKFIDADLVYDGGVCEHVANIGQALSTISVLTRLGGTLVQCVPQNAYGASYYGIDPTLLKDFYEANGFTTLELFILSKRKWKTYLTWAAQKFLFNPNRVCEIRSSCSKQQGTLFTKLIQMMADDHPMSVKRHDWRMKNGFCREVPTMSMVYYVGRRTRPLKSYSTSWPHQDCYPSC